MRDGTRLWVERCGSGVPLLLVPGMGTGTWLWEECIDALADRFALIMPELRGSGRSDKPDERYSVAQFSEDLIALLDELGTARCNVVGVSLGGYIAQELAARWPERVRRLVLVATALGGAAQTGPDGAVLTRLIRPHGRSRRERLEDAYELGFTAAFRATRNDLLDDITAWRLTHPQPEFAYYRQLLAGYAWEGAANVARIAAPTLICAAESDIVVPVQNAAALAAAIPHARVELFSGRHLFFIEHSARFCDVVAQFLAEDPS